MQKKLAFALYFPSQSRTKGVAKGCGPSSNVKYSTLFPTVDLSQIHLGYNHFNQKGVETKYILKDK
jgi:hypothetical protein